MDDEEPAAGRAPRKVSDAQTLRALAHPTRMALLEAVGLHGTLTATQAAEIIGESPTNCAFHLRTLAKHGFLVEAEGGKGRERPWQTAQARWSFDSNETDDAAAAVAGQALAEMVHERWFEQIRRYGATHAHYPREVQDLSLSSASVWFAGLDEIRQLRSELEALMSRFAERTDPEKRPADAIPFQAMLFIHPHDDPPATTEGN